MKILRAKSEDLDIINLYMKDMGMIQLDGKSFNFSSRKIYVIKNNNKIIAFICYLSLMESIELEAIYVDSIFRKQGYGNILLEYMIQEAGELNCRNIFLEVREKNLSAIHLYQKNGFEIIGYRKQYYGTEDGIVMKKELRCKYE
ncbi:MAG: GNAT family N-acetyltransferase [Bacilli bacterium]|nr:GNAT family N-acetyltransferase [Bacilli bacterium]